MIKFSESKTENTKLSLRCNTCKHDTYHTVIRAVEYKSTFDAEPEYVKENDLWVNGTAQIIICDGCNTISFRHKFFFSEEPGPNEDIYPPRETKTELDELYLRDDVHTVPRIVRTIYNETLLAIERKNRDCSIVTGNILFHSSHYEVSVLFANVLEPVLLVAYR